MPLIANVVSEQFITADHLNAIADELNSRQASRVVDVAVDAWYQSGTRADEATSC